MSKIDSLVNIIRSLSPDILVICETKHKNPPVLRTIFKKIGYGIIVRKESGVLIAYKVKLKTVETTVSTHPNIITGRFKVKDTIIRIIAAYGPQENTSLETRSEFYDELSTEIESCVRKLRLLQVT